MAKKINEWLFDIFSSILSFFTDLFSQLLGVVDTQLDFVNTCYTVFASMCSVLIVTVALSRIISKIVYEGERGMNAYAQEAVLSQIIIDIVKSCAALPIMVWIQGFLQSKIIIPLLEWMFSSQGTFAAESVTNATMAGGIAISGILLVLYILFFLVVLGVFFFKMAQYYANMAFFTVTIPFVAVSGVSENFNYIETWWKKLLYINVTLVAQVLSLTIVIWSATRAAELLYFMALIGFGILTIKAPTVIEDFWASSGTTRKAGQGALALAKMALLKR